MTVETRLSSGVGESLHITLIYLRCLPDGMPANIRIYLIFLETRIIGLHFARDSMSSSKCLWWAP